MIVYIIHFSKKLGHAQHYVGMTINFSRRMHLHRMGQGARILKACNDQGINWRVVWKMWGSRTLERQIKASKNAGRYCPVCKRKATARRKRQQARKLKPHGQTRRAVDRTAPAHGPVTA